MPFQPVPGTAKFTLIYQLFGREVVNILNADFTGGISPAILDEACEALYGVWAANVVNELSNQLDFLRVEAVDLSVEIAETGIFVPESAVSGTVAGESLPANCALVMSLRTGYTGRSQRGRMFLPGIAESSVEGNTPDASIRGGLANTLAIVNAALASVSIPFTWVVLSRYTEGALRAEGVTLPVTSVLVDTRIDSQRRRLG